jgi:UDP-N-acetylmuramate dehydrogenase
MQEAPHLLNGKLLQDVSLADYNAWRVGGSADLLYIPSNISDLAQFIKTLPSDLPLCWLGLGSNVLIRDGGIEGAVIVTQGGLTQLTQTDSYHIRAEAGVSCAQLARFSARLGLEGLEFMAGIPGTVGGALAMNAGCYGGETWRQVVRVETINRQGHIYLHDASDYEVGYRHVKKPEDEWFLAGHFLLKSGEKTRSLSEIRVLLEKRNASQPTGLPNCGSVFRNPSGDYAARLIETCHLKGYKIGNAIISEKHANFIINEGTASASDIEALIEHIGNTVYKQHGVRLVPEVCIIGNRASRKM